MKNNNRIIRINDEIKKTVSEIIKYEIKDPRVSNIITILKVDTSNDLKYCKVFISILGNDDEKDNVLEGLKNASGFIRKLVAEKINLRVTPQFKFLIDDSLEYSIKISKLIEKVNKGE